MVQTDEKNLNLLIADCTGDNAFEYDIIHREATHDIEKIIADNNKLYVLTSSGTEYFLKIFGLGPDCKLVSMGMICNLEQS